MVDRELFDLLRRRARPKAYAAAKALDDPASSDGMMAPHVAQEKITNLRKLGEELILIADVAEKLK